MVAIPTVNSFCGCCDLKVACVIIASSRFIIYTIAILVYFVLFFFFGYALTEDRSKSTPESVKDSLTDSKLIEVEIGIFVYLWLIIKFVIAVVNILCSYWFIRGATSVRRCQYKTKKLRKLVIFHRNNPIK